jgi:transcriptional regulator with XRE-family HTH domain
VLPYHRGNRLKIETLQALCEAFGITLSQFFLEDEQTEILSQKEKELISSFRALSPEKQQALLNFIKK